MPVGAEYSIAQLTRKENKMGISKGAIDYHEFLILVRNTVANNEEDFFNSICALVERVNVWKSETETDPAERDLTADEAKETVAGVNYSGFGSFLKDLPDETVKTKKSPPAVDYMSSREPYDDRA